MIDGYQSCIDRYLASAAMQYSAGCAVMQLLVDEIALGTSHGRLQQLVKQ